MCWWCKVPQEAKDKMAADLAASMNPPKKPSPMKTHVSIPVETLRKLVEKSGEVRMNMVAFDVPSCDNREQLVDILQSASELQWAVLMAFDDLVKEDDGPSTGESGKRPRP